MKLLLLLAGLGAHVYVYKAVWDHDPMLAVCCMLAGYFALALSKGSKE